MYKFKSNYITLDHNIVNYSTINQYSNSIKVNPYKIESYHGHIELFPKTDSEPDLNTPPIVLKNETNISPDYLNKDLDYYTNDNEKTEVILKPYLRSIKVYFRAFGLKPHTRFFPFFENINISLYTRQEIEVLSNSNNDYKELHEHPDGWSKLLSNKNGELTGSFIIPNNSEFKFSAGKCEFLLISDPNGDETIATSLAKSTFNSSGKRDNLKTKYTSSLTLNRYSDAPSSITVDQAANAEFIDFIENKKLPTLALETNQQIMIPIEDEVTDKEFLSKSNIITLSSEKNTGKSRINNLNE